LNWAQAREFSLIRRCKYLLFLRYTVSWLDKDLDKVDKDDIIYLIGKIVIGTKRILRVFTKRKELNNSYNEEPKYE